MKDNQNQVSSPLSYVVHGALISHVPIPSSKEELVKFHYEFSELLKRNVSIREIVENFFGSLPSFIAFERTIQKQTLGNN